VIGGTMSVKDDYLFYRESNGFRTSIFDDRVKLQLYLKSRLEDIWHEKPKFTNGGLFVNHMTKFALGFAYYDCKPTKFCRTKCYGLPIAGLNDYYMLRLAVITSESLKNSDRRFLIHLIPKIRELEYLKIGHWGDATREQIPIIESIIRESRQTKFWWYTRKLEIATLANSLGLPNLKAYLSLDPYTEYPSPNDYPYGITYLVGSGLYHPNHKEILNDWRLVAIFPLKRGVRIEDLRNDPRVGTHPKLCEEKVRYADSRKRGYDSCFECSGRCRF
jgi:hypothetical protein